MYARCEDCSARVDVKLCSGDGASARASVLLTDVWPHSSLPAAASRTHAHDARPRSLNKSS